MLTDFQLNERSQIKASEGLINKVAWRLKRECNHTITVDLPSEFDTLEAIDDLKEYLMISGIQIRPYETPIFKHVKIDESNRKVYLTVTSFGLKYLRKQLCND